jgi:hypothetical protein
MAADREIDQLYSLPLSEFTAARNQLASSRGKAGAAVKKLAKPSLAAWVVNQIYWHHRAAYDAVVAATESRRTAHGRVLSGRNADLTAADRDTRRRSRPRSATPGPSCARAGKPSRPRRLPPSPKPCRRCRAASRLAG